MVINFCPLPFVGNSQGDNFSILMNGMEVYLLFSEMKILKARYEASKDMKFL